MPGRITCNECVELERNNCEICKKPHGLNVGNDFAYTVWKMMMKARSLNYFSFLEAFGGSVDDLEKVIIIDSIFRRLNVREQV